MTSKPNLGPEDGSTNGPGEEPTFEASMDTVESIIESIESGELGLEDSIRAYERAAGLLKSCREELRSAELRVEKISDLLEDDPAERDEDESG